MGGDTMNDVKSEQILYVQLAGYYTNGTGDVKGGAVVKRLRGGCGMRGWAEYSPRCRR